jgi:hypothetical protein
VSIRSTAFDNTVAVRLQVSVRIQYSRICTCFELVSLNVYKDENKSVYEEKSVVLKGLKINDVCSC